MSKEEFLAKLSILIKSGDYDVEQLVSMIPEELLLDVFKMLQEEVKEEAKETEREIKGRYK